MSDHASKSLSSSKPFGSLVPADQTAVVLVAHGERGGTMQNASLAAHVGALASDGFIRTVVGGVLNGTPTLGDALAQARSSGAKRILVYPLFMAPGYFVDIKLPDEIHVAGCDDISEILTPLGSDPNLPAIMLRRAVGVARKANLSPALARLVVVGHGSKSGTPASAYATRQFAATLRGRGVFGEVDVAFLEEAPSVQDVLTASKRPTVVIGYFYAAGLHAAEDVPEAIAETGADAIYTGAVGADMDTTNLIRKSIFAAVATPPASVLAKDATTKRGKVKAGGLWSRLRNWFAGTSSK